MFIKLIRIGRDSTLRFTQSGKAVCSVVGAFDIGWGDNKRTTWIEGALWEKRAEALAPYLLKGQQAVVTFDDLEVEQYDSNGKPGAKLKGRIVDIQLCGAKPEGQQQQPRQQQAPAPQQQAPNNFDDSDIPF